MKKKFAKLNEVSIFCPKLDRNVRLSTDRIEWDARHVHEDFVLHVKVNCRCGEQHEVCVSYLPDPCVWCNPYPDYK